MTDAVVAIEGVPRDYAWGSTTAIQAMLGAEPDGRPLAELWFGAHPGGPARVPALGTTLDRLIAADPVAALGAGTAARFGGQLPFLLKVLAADKPLSIQVHPTRAQAEAGFAAEDAAGIARDASERNYRDRNHKPELLCAVTPFTALCGFRAPTATVALIDDLPARVGAALADVRADLTGADPSAALRAAFTRLLTLPDDARAALVHEVVAGCRELVTPHAPLAAWADGAIGAARVVDLCARHFPGDVGAVLSLLLNATVLQPGEAIYLGAGTVHAYLRGLGVEVMADSDNVLRCGLTPKHVDVEELLAITDFTELADPRGAVEQVGPAWRRYEVPVADFALERIDLGANDGAVDSNSELPRIALCVSGEVGVRSLAGDSVRLRPGGAAFVAGTRFTTIFQGTGEVFVATVSSP